MAQCSTLQDLFSVKDKVALVTGASSGIGLAFARFLAGQGAKVVLAARRAEKLEAAVKEIKATGGEAAAIYLDVSKGRDTIADGIANAAAVYGHIDILVNNAGVFVGGSALDDTQEQFDSTYSVNVGGMYFTAQAVAKHMIEKGIKGRIINTASIVATVIPPGTALYSSSKAAVVSLTKGLAVELAPKGINVNSISPGVFPSEMSDGIVQSAGSKKAQLAVPNHRWGDTEHDMMGVLLLLAAEKASAHLVGCNINVDGGHSLYTFNMVDPTAIFEDKLAEQSDH
eukprot:TRINITY_DN10470_c0_g1_i1.p1 TRINITY_DN10470_c0_g1~~TRINITY_DN10470_c0_g1_i1.p1  ORF type:complete len:284 (-),score=93.38 TRINITY_DN10470_c0_g1_i1:532-1383(-)